MRVRDTIITRRNDRRLRSGKTWWATATPEPSPASPTTDRSRSGALPPCAVQAAARQARCDPRVSDADLAVETAHADQNAIRQRHQHERTALLVSEYGVLETSHSQFGMALSTLDATPTTPAVEPPLSAPEPMNSAASPSRKPPDALRQRAPNGRTHGDRQ